MKIPQFVTHGIGCSFSLAFVLLLGAALVALLELLVAFVLLVVIVLSSVLIVQSVRNGTFGGDEAWWLVLILVGPFIVWVLLGDLRRFFRWLVVLKRLKNRAARHSQSAGRRF